MMDRGDSGTNGSIALVPFDRRPDLGVVVSWRIDSAEVLALRYEISDAHGLVAWPARATTPGRREELWRNTCCELFLVDSESQRYIEWNASPTGDWMVQGFRSYRERSDLPVIDLAPQAISTGVKPGLMILEYAVPLRAVRDTLGHDSWQWRPNCVLLLNSGEMTYWAIAHPADKADFHRFV
jgi:hypothetical protein